LALQKIKAGMAQQATILMALMLALSFPMI
jgi:hypothetical protein